MSERDWPHELDRLIAAVAAAEDPYEAAREVTARAGDCMVTSAVASGLWHVWSALEDRYELRTASEDDATFATMRRASVEWSAVKDDATAREAYLDRWQYEELGYERLVPKGWDVKIEEMADGSFRALARGPAGERVSASGSWFDVRDAIRARSHTMSGTGG